MTTRRTDVGREAEAALGEVLAHVRGTIPLPCRIVDDPADRRIVGATQANEARDAEAVTQGQTPIFPPDRRV